MTGARNAKVHPERPTLHRAAAVVPAAASITAALDCDACGRSRPHGSGRTAPAVVKGTPSEINDEHLERVVPLSYRAFISQPRTHAELEGFARHYGYKPDWVWQRLREQEEV
jgi:hypothetical protein